MVLNKGYSNEYVCCLPSKIEKKIMTAVKETLSTLILSDQEKREAIINANNSKLCDLTDTINLVFE